jgi:hypothetical protein
MAIIHCIERSVHLKIGNTYLTAAVVDIIVNVLLYLSEPILFLVGGKRSVQR